MAVIETWFEQDLQKPVKVRYIDGNLFSHNGNGNRIGVIVTNNGEAVTLTGTVSGYAVLADGTTVPCTGTRSGNKASILIPAAAYSPGSILISIFLTDGTTVTTLAALSSSVIMARTGNQIDPGSVVTDWTNTINAAMQSVETAAANLGNIVATPYANLTFPVPLGKYTIYNNGLYRCISPIASSEAWTAAHWTNVKLGDEVTELKSAIDQDVLIQSNAPYICGWEQGGIAGNGSLNNLTTRIRTKTLLCRNVASIEYSAPSGYESWIIFLNKDGSMAMHGDWDSRTNIVITINNQNWWYFRYAIRRTDGADISISEGDAITITPKPYSDVYTDSKIADISSEIETLENAPVIVDINGTGDYTSILQALKANQSNKRIIVKSGTYNVVDEYVAMYGTAFWDNYAGFGGSTDNFLRGLYVSDVILEFESDSQVVFNYSGNNAKVAQYFSVFATGQNATIMGAYIDYGNGIAEYAIHDDHATEAGTNILKNIIIDGVPSGRGGNHIGVGCGVNNSYIYDGIVFLDTDMPSNYGDIYFHNNIASGAENRIYVRNCCGLRGCTFRYYGQSNEITYCIANGNKFRSIALRQHTTDGTSPNENMVLIAFNNETET